MAASRKTSFQLFVAGRKGQGKTTLTDAIAAGRNRNFCFDTLGEYRAKGYTRVNSMAELKTVVRAKWAKGFKIAYVPSTDNRAAQLDEMARAICAIQKPYYDTPDGKRPPIPKVLFIIEEMRWSYPPNCPFDGLATLTTLGRHYGVDMIGTTQRTAEVSVNFRGTSDVRYFFAQDEARDITTIAQMIGREHVASLKALRPHEYLRMYNGQIAKGKNVLKR